MDLLIFFGKASLLFSILWIIWSYVVDYFQWNYKGDAYWVAGSAFYVLWFVWILFFVYFILLSKKI